MGREESFAMWRLLLLALFSTIFLPTPSTSASDHETMLLDSWISNVTWEQLSLRHNEDVWAEETWNNEQNKNVPTYVTCSVDQTNASNWIFMPVVPVGPAKQITMRLMFSTRNCASSFPDLKTCKETFNAYARQYGDSEVVANSTLLKATFQSSLKQWSKIGVMYGKGETTTTEEITVRLQKGTKSIRFAFEEQGVCVSLLYIKMFYRTCDEQVQNFVRFPEAVAGSPDEPVKVNGTCVQHASRKYDVNLMGLCMATGKMMHTSGECECNQGYSSFVSTDLDGHTTTECRACPLNTFKQRGFGECVFCPPNSMTSAVASGSCMCVPGYFRPNEDPINAACTQTPTRPVKLKIVEVTSTSVRLSWEEPSNLGGRKEIWYEVSCGGRGDCSNVQVNPPSEKILSRTAVINGLLPNSEYTFYIYAKNKVSALMEAKFGSVDVMTMSYEDDRPPIGPLRVDAKQNDGVTISWPPTDGATQEYEVEIRPSASGKRNHEIRLINTTYITFIGLKPDVTYTFKARSRNDPRWSLPLVYDVTHGQIRGQTSKEKVDVAGMVKSTLFDKTSYLLIALIIVLVVIACALCVMVLQRRNRNRKQMSDLDVLDTYKQDSMTPDYHTASRHMPNSNAAHLHEQFRSVAKLNAPLIPFGSPISQPPPYYGGPTSGKYKAYVDPTAYEDPNLALNEFAFDIDPSDVFITQVIGGGEFGDVCLGGLSRNSAASTRGSSRMFDNEFETVAIKTLKSGSNAKAKSEFLIEASIMGQFSHPNVIRLIGVVTASEPNMIVTEYMSNGSLDQYMRNTDAKGEKLAWERVCEMLHGIASGMKYLTDMGYVHRDLAARNVLVDAELRCKIADFGLSRGVEGSVEQEYTTNGGKIPVRWTAPEAITHRKFTAASDVWSFGVVMWEVCSYGERPYWDWTNQKVISEVMIGYRLPPPMDCPMGLYRLAQWCWRMERHERPSFAQLVAMLHKYILQPHVIHTDPGELPKRSMSTANLNGYGSIANMATSMSTSTTPTLDEFLRSIGMHHCYGQLMAHNISSVGTLARQTHLDLLACGLISQECATLRDALQSRLCGHANLGMQLPPTPPGTTTLPSVRGGRVAAVRRDQGFFV